jgi:hypothetical protein
MERWNLVRNHLKYYTNVQVSAIYTIPKSLLLKFGNLENLTYAALSKVIPKHPILGVTIKDEASLKPEWARLESIDLRQITKKINADPSGNWVKAAHTNPFGRFEDLKLPLWRILLVSVSVTNGEDDKGGMTKFAIGFFYHHAIGDGLSGGAFHYTFLDALNALISNDSPSPTISNHVVPIPKQPLLPTLEMATPLHLTWSYTLTTVFSSLVYWTSPKIWTGPPIPVTPTLPPPSKMSYFILSSPIVTNLVSLCRSEKTTLTSLLAILVARKLALEQDGKGFSRFVAAIPFSMRKFTGNSPTDMGAFVSAVSLKFSSNIPTAPLGYIRCWSDRPARREDEHLWDSARECRRVIQEGSKSTTNQTVGLVKYIANDYKKYFLGMLGQKRKESFEMSNIGVLDGGVEEPTSGKEGDDQVKRQKATFDRVVFCQGAYTYGQPFTFTVVTAKNGDMCVVLTWEDGVVEGKDAEGLLMWLEGELRGLGED